MDIKKVLEKVRKNIRDGKEISQGISEYEWRELLERYSSFSDMKEDGFIFSGEVRIKDFNTPRPCLHLLASNHCNEYGTWGSFWDQFNGGFSCLDSVLAGKMTSHLDTNYVPTAPEVQDVRRFFIYESGRSWPMFPLSCFEEERYDGLECIEGLDYHIVRATREQLQCELKVFVHPDKPMEMWAITIRNIGEENRSFSWFSSLRVNIDSFPFYYFVPRVVCEGLYENDALVFLNHDKGNKHKRQAFFASDIPFDGFDMMGEVFDGIGGRGMIPLAVRSGKCSNSLGLQPYAGLVAAVQFKSVLKPNEQKRWVCVYGSCPYDEDERKKYIEDVRADLCNYDGNFERLKEIWKKKVFSFVVRTKDEEFDRYFNVWSRYQARNQSRFVRALDKIGYRDILQDLLGICDFESEYVRRMLLKTLSYQLEDGRAIRQYSKFRGGGHDMRMYMDSPGWIADLLVRYLKESGDFSILEEQVPYFDMELLDPGDKTGSVYEHALKGVRSLADNTGFNGLCKIGYGDWNDALSGIGGEKGVSVWLSCLCVYAAQRMYELSSYLGHSDIASEMSDIVKTMTDRINEYAWDGNWYIYAINGKGVPIGSDKNAEGKIHLNVNTWALFTGIAKAGGREDKVWKSIEKLATAFGHRLIWPSYTARSREDVGRIADQKPGMFENGSIYTHGESFYLYALITAGKIRECYDGFMSTIPSSLIQDISTGPRHQQSNFTVGPDHVNYGAQLFSNFTGSISWYRRVAEKLIGLESDFDSLIVTPNGCELWGTYQVRKVWRGKKILVDVRCESTSDYKVKLNGKDVGNRIEFEKLSSETENVIEIR